MDDLELAMVIPFHELEALAELCYKTSKRLADEHLPQDPISSEMGTPEAHSGSIAQFAHSMFLYYLERNAGYTDVMQIMEVAKEVEREEQMAEYTEYMRLKEKFESPPQDTQ